MAEYPVVDRCKFCLLPYYEHWAHTPLQCWDTRVFETAAVEIKRKDTEKGSTFWLQLKQHYLRTRLKLYRFNSRVLAIYWRWKYPIRL